MTDAVRMTLVFRLGAVGFALPVRDLVEIREDPGGALDLSMADPESMVLGGLLHRGEAIPVRDLARSLALPSAHNRAIVLILNGETVWGAAVDRVDGIFPDSEFDFRPLPVFFGASALPYSSLELWRDEPLVLCEAARLERLWGECEL